MRNPQPSISPADSDAFVVVKIGKRAALLLCIGLIALAAALIYRPAQTSAPAADDAAASAAVPQPALPPTSQAASSGPNESNLPSSEVNPPPPIDSVVPNRDPAFDVVPDPPRDPLPVVTVTRRIVTYYPAEAAPPATTTPDSSAADSARSEQPAASTPTPTSDPASPSSVSTAPAVLIGAGSSSPYLLYSEWFDGFHRLHPDVQFNYQAVGSQAGLRQVVNQTVDFGAVDAPLTNQQLASAGIPILQVPSVIGAVVLVYNLPGAAELRFTPQMLAGIFTGKITSWNDPLIAAYNPIAKLPALPIDVIHRSDGCASTQIFTDYLSKISSEWQQRTGEGTSVNWPLGMGAKGNEGVAGLLKQTYGAIAYMDFQFASEHHIEFASLQNRSGHFIKADPQSLTAAAASSDIPADFRVWITDAPGRDAYPIASFTWFVLRERDSNAESRDMVAFLRWVTESSQQATAAKLGFAPLPRGLAERLNDTISRMR